MIDKNRLQAKCSTWNIPLTGAQLDLLDRYAELLVSYNEKVNLTAITSPEGIEDRHFADSLLFAVRKVAVLDALGACLLYTSPSPRDAHESRMPSSA